MSTHTAVRLLHDLGAATWFGGSLMGATGLNGAAAEVDDPAQRARVATAGWSRWAPVAGAAVVAHVVGAGGLAVTDRKRVLAQHGAGRSTAVKTALTVAGLGVSAWSATLNRTMAAQGDVPVAGATEASAQTPPDAAKALQQLKLVQWLNPLLSGAVIVAGSWQSEQQRATQVAPGVLKKIGTTPGLAVPIAGVAALGALAARRKKSSSAPSRDRQQLPPVVWHTDPAAQQPAPSPKTVREPAVVSPTSSSRPMS